MEQTVYLGYGSRGCGPVWLGRMAASRRYVRKPEQEAESTYLERRTWSRSVNRKYDVNRKYSETVKPQSPLLVMCFLRQCSTTSLYSTTN